MTVRWAAVVLLAGLRAGGCAGAAGDAPPASATAGAVQGNAAGPPPHERFQNANIALLAGLTAADQAGHDTMAYRDRLAPIVRTGITDMGQAADHLEALVAEARAEFE